MNHFEYVYTIPYDSRLGNHHIDALFGLHTYKADQVTDSDRSLWCLRMTASGADIAFKQERDRDLFTLACQYDASPTSSPVGQRTLLDVYMRAMDAPVAKPLAEAA